MIAGMTIDIWQWMNLALRWLHLTTGIAWIGSSFYFVWLDNHLRPPASGEASGEVWSVHGGGFYHSQKYLVAPSTMPDELHWFKWEAYFTWISGFSLLFLVYYADARSFLIDPAKADLGVVSASGIGLGFLLVGWLFYDVLCRSPLGRSNRAIGVIWFGFLLGAAVLLDGVFTARGAYLHIGAMLGTVMVANVFLIIIPSQRKAVNELIAGRVPDPALGAMGKQRSLHNNYMTLPVLFIMISPHYPMTYGAQRPWLVLALIALTGVAVRHLFNLRHRGKTSRPLLALVAVLALGTISYVSLEKVSLEKVSLEKSGAAKSAATGERPTFAQVQPILAKHCTSCHSQHPANPAVTSPPLGVVLDSYDHVGPLVLRIKKVAVDAEIMPLGNPTGMTTAERQTLGAWIAQGTPR